VRILLVEDDDLLAAGIRDTLERALYAVEWVADGVQALAALQANAFDLVILDLGLPRLDGIEVLKRVRVEGATTPVIVLSARDTANDRVIGLDAGADDYLVKPFDVDELLARVRAQQRRLRGAASIEHGPLRLDPAALSVTFNGAPVTLQRREFMLLQRLLQSPGQVLSRAQLEEALYGWDSGVESNSVDVHIHKLRRKFYPEVIRTVRGMGYTVDSPPAEPTR
jgi:two-component system, OmpR family, response regulator QseB